MKKRDNRYRKVKGFGSSWLQVPIPTAESKEHDLEESKNSIFTVTNRKDTIPQAGKHQQTWTKCAERFSRLGPCSHKLHAESVFRELSIGGLGSAVATKPTKKYKSTTMRAQYLPKDTKMNVFEWTDHDLANYNQDADVSGLKSVALLSHASHVLDSFIRWKATITENELAALQKLIDMAE